MNPVVVMGVDGRSSALSHYLVLTCGKALLLPAAHLYFINESNVLSILTHCGETGWVRDPNTKYLISGKLGQPCSRRATPQLFLVVMNSWWTVCPGKSQMAGSVQSVLTAACDGGNVSASKEWPGANAMSHHIDSCVGFKSPAGGCSHLHQL